MADPITNGKKIVTATEGRNEKGHFMPGFVHPKAGRPKGSKHKLQESFVSALQKDFDENGEEAIVKVREERPSDYLKVIASIIPKDLTVTADPYEDISDDELRHVAARLSEAIGLDVGVGGRTEGARPKETVQ